MNNRLFLFIVIIYAITPDICKSLGGLTYKASFYGTHTTERVGYHVHTAGDVNGDGYDDFLIGTFHNNASGANSGAAYLILGRKRDDWQFEVSLRNADARFIGGQAYDAAGYCLGGGGDLNGDGYQDILIGAPAGDSRVADNPGHLYLMFGKSLVDWGYNYKLPLNADASFDGEEGQDLAALSVAFIGDINSDGFDDLMCGAPYNDYETYDGGKAYLILGKASGWSRGVNLSQADASFYGAAHKGLAGYSVDGVGDVNGDGIPDFAIGARGEDKVYLFFGRRDVNWGFNCHVSKADVIFSGEYWGAWTGWRVSRAGDVNNDGFDDILIGAPMYGNSAGKVYLIFGRSSGWNGNLSDANASFIGEQWDDQAGWDVQDAGDVNGDGFADFVIGAWLNDANGDESGKMYLIKGKTSGWQTDVSLAQIPDYFIGEHAGDDLGFSVGNAGDVNGDGWNDVVVSATYNSEALDRAGKIILFVSDNPAPKLSINPIVVNLNSLNTVMGFTVTNIGGQTLQWQAAVNPDQPWLTAISPDSGGLTQNQSQSVSVFVDRAGLNSGSYSGIISITTNGGSQNVTVNLTVDTNIPPNLTFTDITIPARTGGPTGAGQTGGHAAVFADVDGDNQPDLYITMSKSDPMSDLFFHNNGNNTFTNKGAVCGIDDYDGGSYGACFADLDNDGDLDLYNGAASSIPECPAINNIYKNNGSGYFTDVTDSTGIPVREWPTRAVLAFDMESDGDLDLFAVTNAFGSNDPLGEHNEIYRNEGNMRFTVINSGTLYDAPACQGATDTDYDGDGDIDIITANRTGSFNILQNDGNGNFALLSPSAIGIKHNAGDGITVGDVNNDGYLDMLLATDDEGHLYINNMNGAFTFQQSFSNTDGYMGGFADLDNDGDLDLIFAGDDICYLNDGYGHFYAGSTIPVIGINDPRAVGFADIDNDGDLDFAFACSQSRNWLVRNNFNTGNWLKVKLISLQGQAGAFGVKVRLYPAGQAGGTLLAMREARSNNGYLGQDDPILHFGLGTYGSIDIVATFIDGSTATLHNIAANQTIAVTCYTVSVSIDTAATGSVTKLPEKPLYTEGDTITFTATPIADYAFDHWSGDLTGTENPVTVIIDHHKSITAHFVKIVEVVTNPNAPTGTANGYSGQLLTFSVGGSESNLKHQVEYQFDWGDTILSSWGSSTQSHKYYSYGTMAVTVRARCTTHTSIVSAWSAAKNVTITGYAISISINPAATGSVTKLPEKPLYAEGDTVTFTATPIADYAFDHWSGDLSGTENPDTIIINGNKTITAHFAQILEVVTKPGKPTGPANGFRGQLLTFSVGGSESNLKHQIEYQIDWGDGDVSLWGDSTEQQSTNITRITSPVGFSGLPYTEKLIDYVSGKQTPVTLTVTGGEYAGSTHAWYGAEPDNGTDAYLVFNGIVSCVGTIAPVNDQNSPLILTFTGMNPARQYDLVFFSNRDDYGWDQASLATISDVDSFINNSSQGVDNNGKSLFVAADDSSTRLPADNTHFGYVVRFTNINAGEDGKAMIIIRQLADGNANNQHRGNYASALMLQEMNTNTSEVLFTAYNDLAWGDQIQSHLYQNTGVYSIQAKARCGKDSATVVSDWSDKLDVSITGCNLMVNIDPANSGSVSETPEQTDYDYGTAVTLYPTGNEKYQFAYWNGTTSDTIKTKIITLQKDTTLVAQFQPVSDVADGQKALPAAFELYQNYPNPFNAETIIRFSLPSASYVHLIIYNQLGQQIRTLVDGDLTAGSHRVVWNGKRNDMTDVSSGIYFYKLTLSDMQIIKKMILMR